MPAEMPKAIRELTAALGEQGVQPHGPLFAHHLKMPSQTFDFEVGFPLNAPVRPAGRVMASELPAATLVRTVYHGKYEGLPNAWQEFMRQAREHVAAAGFSMGNTIRETYLTGAEADPDPSTWRTELAVPLVVAKGPR